VAEVVGPAPIPPDDVAYHEQRMEILTILAEGRYTEAAERTRYMISTLKYEDGGPYWTKSLADDVRSMLPIVVRYAKSIDRHLESCDSEDDKVLTVFYHWAGITEDAVEINKAIYGGSSDEVSLCLEAMGCFIAAREDFVPAEEAIEKAIELERQCHGEGTARFAALSGYLGDVYNRTYYPEFGTDYIKTALRTLESAGLKETEDYAIILGYWVKNLIKRRLPEDGLQPCNELVGLRRRLQSTSPLDLARALKMSSEVKWSIGMVEEAEREYLEAIMLDAQAHGSPSLVLANDHSTLAEMFMHGFKHQRAVEEKWKAVQTVEAARGQDSMYYFQVLTEYCLLLFHSRRYKEAEALINPIMRGTPLFSGKNWHHGTKLTIILARIYLAQGDLKRALGLLSQIERDIEGRYDKSHRENLLCILNRARSEAMMMAGDFDEADRCARLSMGMGRDVYWGLSLSQHLARAFIDRSDMTYVFTRYDEMLVREALVEYAREYPPSHIVMVRCANDLAETLIIHSDLPEADNVLRKNLEILRRAFGESHPEVARTYRIMGRLQEGLKNQDEAESYLRKAFTIDFQLHGDGSIHLAIDMRALGELMLRRGDLAEADHLLRTAIQIYQGSMQGPSELMAGVVRSYGEVARARNDVQGWRWHLYMLMSIYSDILGREHPISKKASQVFLQATGQSI